jgi:hypothetical protein
MVRFREIGDKTVISVASGLDSVPSVASVVPSKKCQLQPCVVTHEAQLLCPEPHPAMPSDKAATGFPWRETRAEAAPASNEQRVLRVETERGSTGNRTWFDSKQNVLRLEAHVRKRKMGVRKGL